MYSLVLMAALSTGGEAPSFFFHKWGGHGCHGGWSGCHGCWGGGGGCHGGWGGCHGCWGGGGWGHRRSGHGCWGGGCHGSYSSCWGGCYGGGYSAGYGCHGGCYGGYAAPMMMAPGGAPVMMPGGEAPKAETIAPPKQGQMSAPAKLLVELPENAKFFVDDQPMKTPSAARSFNTPVLHAGQTYYYMLRAEVERDGKNYQETKRILVRAGETVRATFPELERSLAAAAPATVTADAGDDGDQ